MSHSHECPCGRPRAGCEYHDPAMQVPIQITVPPGTKLPTSEDFAREWAAKHGLRLLGPDDPDVSSDLIYLDEATGGVVGVPQSPAARAPHTGVTIGGLHLQRSDYRVVTVTPGCGRFRITLPLGSERETKLNAMYQADQLALRYNPRIPLVQVDAPALQVRTDRGWFLSRLVGVPAAATVTYVMGFVR